MHATLIKGTRPELAPVFSCAWCPKPEGVRHVFLTIEDAERAAAGAPITHGICASCESKLEATLGS